MLFKGGHSMENKSDVFCLTSWLSIHLLVTILMIVSALETQQIQQTLFFMVCSLFFLNVQAPINVLHNNFMWSILDHTLSSKLQKSAYLSMTLASDCVMLRHHILCERQHLELEIRQLLSDP